MHIYTESICIKSRNICSGTQFYLICSIITTAHSVTITSKFIEFTVVNKVCGSYSRINFQPLDGNCNIIALLHLPVYLHTSSKWRFYNNCICRVCEQIIRRGSGIVLTHKREQHSNCERGCQKKVFYKISDMIWT